jgi:hypothetical protein
MTRLSARLMALGLAALSAPDARAAVIYSSNFDANDGGLVSTSLGGSAANPFTYGPTAGVGGNGAWFINPSTIVSDKALTGPSLVVGAAGAVTISFDHRYSFESTFDGGQLYVSVNGGAFALVPTAAFSSNGYTGTISVNFQSPIGGQMAFTGASAGYATPAYITSTATLGSFAAGDTIAFRFRAAYDNSLAAGTPSWVIDNVVVSDSAVGPPSAVVPEPASLALLGVGAGLAGVRRLRGRKQPA